MPKFANIQNCTGCTACASVCPTNCIEMSGDKNGFKYPKIIDAALCLECGACEQVCPITQNDIILNVRPKVYSAISLDYANRLESSSGGIFFEIAKRIIARNGVVYGAAYDDDFSVYHCCADNIADLRKFRGAKYAESDLGNLFDEILEKLKRGQYVLFSGTPCQVAGLKSFVKKEYDNLYCVDFVCHGVPSPMAWKAYIEYRAKRDADGELPKAINLRSKNTGWSHYQYSNVFEYENGKRHSILSSDSLFMKLFVGNYISRPSCENCKFKGYSRVSDMTLGDFWGIWDIDSEMDDGNGTSVVLIQSRKGQALWNEISDKIKFKEVLLEQASRQNTSMLESSKANPKREEALNKIRDGRIEECESLFAQPKIFMADKIKRRILRLFRWHGQ